MKLLSTVYLNISFCVPFACERVISKNVLNWLSVIQQEWYHQFLGGYREYQITCK